MKRLISLSVFIVLLTLPLFGQPVSLQQAQGFARRYLAAHNLSMPASELSLLESSRTAPASRRMPSRSDAQPLYYILGSSGAEGFVVVAGDQRMGPVVACVTGAGYDADSLPEGFVWWLEATAQTAAALLDGKASLQSVPAPAAAGLPESVEPFVKTQWGQGWPYNLQCPYDATNAATSVTGCVATAMAQVLNYYGYPSKGTGMGTYTVNGKNPLTEDIATYSLDYAATSPFYGSDEKGTTQEQRTAVADIMKACGVAAGMNYRASSSTASSSCYRYIYNFGYDVQCRDVYRAQYSQAGWANLIRSELAEGHPVHYGGRRLTNAAGTGTAGHAFLCDGYNADGLYHINWGWGGKYNGFFSLDNLYEKNPQEYSYEAYNYAQSAIVGICPRTDSRTTPVRNLVTLGFYDFPSDVAKGASANIIFTLATEDRAFDGKVGLGIFSSLEATTTVGRSLNEYQCPEPDGKGYLVKNTLSLPSSLTDGTYYVRPVYEGDGADECTIIPLTYTTQSFRPYLVMNVSGGEAQILSPYATSAASLVAVSSQTIGGAYKGRDYTALVRISNPSAEDFAGQVRLTRSGVNVGMTYMKIAAGSWADLYFRVEAPQTGASDYLGLEIEGGEDNWTSLGSLSFVLYDDEGDTPQVDMPFANLDKDTYAPGENARVRLQLHSSQGVFDSEILVWAHSDMGYTFLARRPMTLGPTNTQTMNINFDMPLFKPGSYNLLVADNNYQAQQLINFKISAGGDLNGDGAVNVGDVTTLVNMILGKTATSSDADLNGDGTVNVGDVTTLVNMILGK